MLVTVPGRGPVCFRCQKVGHTRVNCQEVYCGHCQFYGQQITEECPVPGSYVNRAKAEDGTAEDTSDFPADNDEHASTKSTTNIGSKLDTKDQAQTTDKGTGETSQSRDWNAPTSENDSAMSDLEFSLASQTMFEMMKNEDPDAFKVESDMGSVDTDTVVSRRNGSDGEQAKKKHKGQGKGTA